MSFGVSSYEFGTSLPNRKTRHNIMPVTRANKNSEQPGTAFQEIRIICRSYGIADDAPKSIECLHLMTILGIATLTRRVWVTVA
jgi:hypothetical protein